MDLRREGKKKAVATIYNYGEQTAIVNARPRYFHVAISTNERQHIAGVTDFSEKEPFGSGYPFEIEMSLRSLKKIAKNLAKESEKLRDVEVAFGRIAVMTTINEFLGQA